MRDTIDFDRLAYDFAPIGVVLTEHRTMKSCNQTFADMLGYQKSELIGQSFRMLYSSRQEFDDVRDIGIKPLQEKGVYSDERMMIRKDGGHIWCRFRAQTLTPDEPLERTVLSFALISDRQASVSITLRERQVVTYLSQGLTSKEIARQLEISPRTVEDVRGRLLKKFKVKNAAELLARLTSIHD